MVQIAEIYNDANNMSSQERIKTGDFNPQINP